MPTSGRAETGWMENAICYVNGSFVPASEAKIFDFRPGLHQRRRRLRHSRTSPSIVPVKSLNGVPIGEAVPGPVTLRLMREWEKLVGIDFVSQALGHIEDRDKQSLLGEWAKLREA